MSYLARVLTLVQKFNHDHDSSGRFTSKEHAVMSPLDRKIVDFQPDRPLNDKNATTPIESILPGSKYVPYSQTPFLEQLIAQVGVDPRKPEVTGKDYVNAAWEHFQKQPVMRVPVQGLVVTQRMVNSQKIISGMLKYGATEKPIDVVRHDGKYYVMNGHHRLVSDFKRGKTDIPALVWDTGKVSKGYDSIFKDSAASKKAWLSRDRATEHSNIARKLAQSLVDEARQAEPDISASMKDAIAGKGVLKGYEYRLKSLDSLKRKIEDGAKLDNTSMAFQRNNIGDAVRYTVQLPQDGYTKEAVGSILQSLKDAGHTLYPDHFKNYWKPSGVDSPGEYQGINMNLVSPTGQAWELQIHTAGSFKAKEVLNHKLYEDKRKILDADTNADSKKKRDALTAKMVENQRTVKVPRGASDIRFDWTNF